MLPPDTRYYNQTGIPFAVINGNGTNINVGTAFTDESFYSQVQTASDLVKTFNYADVGTTSERVASITYSSTEVNAGFVENYQYEGSSGAYRVTKVSRSPVAAMTLGLAFNASNNSFHLGVV